MILIEQFIDIFMALTSIIEIIEIIDYRIDYALKKSKIDYKDYRNRSLALVRTSVVVCVPASCL